MSFDASAFLNSTVTDALSTRVKPVPEGEYLGQICPLSADSFKSGVSAKGNSWVRLDLQVEITDPRIQEACGVPSRRVRAGLLLDMTPAGGLDVGEGKNIALGRLREAAGLNIPGQPFSPNMLAGRMVKVKVSHRVDPNDPALVYDEIKMFAKVA